MMAALPLPSAPEGAEVPDWVHLLPKGDAIETNDGRGPYLTGPGDGTSDDILMWGSSGEYMINARATAKYRPLLEAINSGANIPGLSTGGPVPSASGHSSPAYPGSVAGSPSQVLGTLRIIPSPEFDVKVEDKAEGVAIEVVREYERNGLPGAVQGILDDPSKLG